MNIYIDTVRNDLQVIRRDLAMWTFTLSELKRGWMFYNQPYRFRGQFSLGFQSSPELRLNIFRGKISEAEFEVARLKDMEFFCENRLSMLLV